MLQDIVMADDGWLCIICSCATESIIAACRRAKQPPRGLMFLRFFMSAIRGVGTAGGAVPVSPNLRSGLGKQTPISRTVSSEQTIPWRRQPPVF